MSRSRTWELSLSVLLLAILGVGLAAGRPTAAEAGRNLLHFAAVMVRLLPCAFVLIALFEVWVRRETIERHMGEGAGLKGYVLATLLAGTIVGGFIVALPLAAVLQRKGAGLGIVLCFLGASAVCRVPMTCFEASFLGLKFTLVRLAVTIPLVMLSSVVLGGLLNRRGFTIREQDSREDAPAR